MIGIELKEPKGFGRIRMRHIPDASGENLLSFIKDTICPDEAEIRTDGWNDYNNLHNQGYTYKRMALLGFLWIEV